MSTRAGPILLAVRDLAVEFPQPGGRRIRTVEGVDLDVDAGEIVCLVGESGCGKSVTVRSLFGLLPPPGRRAEGSVAFDGVDLATLDRRSAARTVRQVGRLRLPGSDDLPQSAADRGRAGGRSGRRAHAIRARSRAGGARARVSCASSASAIRERVAHSYPHQLERRHAPARDDRHGGGAPAASAHPRRADHRARRHRAGADHRSDPRRSGATPARA